MKIFHHTDNDGICSKYIVKRKYPRAFCIPVTYSIPFPYHHIEPDEFIVIVDYSFKNDSEIDLLLQKTTNIIWIDHHRSSLDVKKSIPGVRVDTVPAACFVAWKFFFPNEPMPEVVELVSDYDTWAFKFGDSTKLFNTGLSAYNDNDDEDIWGQLLDDTENGLIDRLTEEGRTIKNYMEGYYRTLLKYASFETVFEGHSAIACNACRINADLYENSNTSKELMIVYFFNGVKYNVSIYSKTVDCEKIAKKYGGGGHRGAAGFQITQLPFQVLENLT